MAECEISISFRFNNIELSKQIALSLTPEQRVIPANEKQLAPGLADNVLPFWRSSSFDEIVCPFPGISFRDEADTTELVLSFSSDQDAELQALILELVDAAMLERKSS